MRRRAFIAGLGSAAALSRGARAQQPEVPAIGYLTAGSPALLPDRVRAFHQGLSETGFVEGQNLAIEYRGIDGRQDGRLAAPGGHHDFC